MACIFYQKYKIKKHLMQLYFEFESFYTLNPKVLCGLLFTGILLISSGFATELYLNYKKQMLSITSAEGYVYLPYKFRSVEDYEKLNLFKGLDSNLSDLQLRKFLELSKDISPERLQELLDLSEQFSDPLSFHFGTSDQQELEFKQIFESRFAEHYCSFQGCRCRNFTKFGGLKAHAYFLKTKLSAADWFERFLEYETLPKKSYFERFELYQEIDTNLRRRLDIIEKPYPEISDTDPYKKLKHIENNRNWHYLK